MPRIQGRVERPSAEKRETDGEGPRKAWVTGLQSVGRDYAKSAEDWQKKRQKAVREAQKLMRNLAAAPKAPGNDSLDENGATEAEGAQSPWIERLQTVGRNYAESAEEWQATRRKAFRDYNDAAERWQARRRQAVRDARELLCDMNVHAAILEIEHRLRRYLASPNWNADRNLSEPPPGSPLRKAIWKLAISTDGAAIGISTLKRQLESHR